MQLQSSPQFRATGQADERRRRVLAEGMHSPDAKRPETTKVVLQGRSRTSSTRSARYGDAAFMNEEMRLTDLVPRRLLSYIPILGGGVLAIAGIDLLHQVVPAAGAFLNSSRTTALDLTASGNLGAWFCSLVLQAAAAITVLIYMIRRHRVDDYHGQYRIWLWAGLTWCILSAEQSIHLRHLAQDIAVRLTGVHMGGDGSVWWAIAYLFLLGAVGMRLLVEMRESLLSCACLVLAALLGGLASACELTKVLAETGVWRITIQASAQMLACWVLWIAMLLHARYVILDVEGLLPKAKPKPTAVRKPRKASAKAADAKTSVATDSDAAGAPVDEQERLDAIPVVRRGSDAKAVDAPHATPAPHIATSAATASAASNPSSPSNVDEENDEAEAGAADSDKKLTKAERKALRKRLDDLKRQREARQAWK